MQQFIVPQFIDVETKIIGPISARQFIIILVAGIISFILYKLMTFFTFVIGCSIVLGFAAALAFAKINGQMFHIFMLNLAQTLKKPRLRVWNKSEASEIIREEKKAGMRVLAQKKIVSSSHLAEVSLLTSTGGIYQEPKEVEASIKLKSIKRTKKK